MKQLIAAVICALFALSTAYAQQPQGEAKKGAPAAEKKAEKYSAFDLRKNNLSFFD